MGGFLLLRAVKWLLSLLGPCAVSMRDICVSHKAVLLHHGRLCPVFMGLGFRV